MQITSDFNFLEAFKVIATSKWWWILAAAGTNILSFFLETFQLWFLARAMGKRPGFWRMWQIYFVGNFFSNATPSTSGGEPFQVFFMLDDGFTVAEGAVMVLVRGLISVMVRILFVVVIVITVLFGYQLSLSKALNIVFFVTLTGFALIVIFGFFVLLNPHIFTFVVNFLSRFKWMRKLLKVETPEEFCEKGKLFIGEIRHASRTLLQGNKAAVFFAILNSIATWFLLKSMPFFVLLALGESPPLLGVFAIGVISQLATAWVPTPGAVGAIEVGMGAFAALMHNPANIGVFILIYRLMDYHMDVLFGAPISIALLVKKFGKKATTTDLSAIGSTIGTQMEEAAQKGAEEDLKEPEKC